MGYFSSYENLKELFSALKTSAMSSFAKKDIYGDNLINGQNIGQIILNYGSSPIDPKVVSSYNTLIIGQQNEFYLGYTGNIYNVVGNNNSIKRNSYEKTTEYSWGTFTSYAQPNNIYMFGRYNKVEGLTNLIYIYGSSNYVTRTYDEFSENNPASYTQEHANLFGYSNSIGGNVYSSDRVNLFGAENSMYVSNKVKLSNDYNTPRFAMCSLFGYRNTLSITNTNASVSANVWYVNAFGMDNSASWTNNYTSGLNMIGYYNSASNPGNNDYLIGRSNDVSNGCGDYVFLFGSNNRGLSGSNYTYAFGHYNCSYNGTGYSALVGTYNNMYSCQYSASTGYNNESRNGSYYYTYGYNNRINDNYNNTEGGSYCTAIGINNQLHSATDTHVFGRDNTTYYTGYNSGYNIIVGRSNYLGRVNDNTMPPSYTNIFGYVNSIKSTYYTTSVGINNQMNNVVNTSQFGWNNEIHGKNGTCAGYLQIGYSNYIENCSGFIQVGINNKILCENGSNGSVYIIGSDNVSNNSSGAITFGDGNKIKNASGTRICGFNNTINDCTAYAFGINNSITSSYGSTLFGSQNTLTSSSGSYVHGSNNTLNSSNGCNIYGYNNTLSNSNSTIIYGNYNEAKNATSFMFGYGLSASKTKFVIGTYNEDKQDNLFELGFGKYENHKNILEINNREEVIAKDFVTADGVKLSSIKNSNELRMKSIQNIISQQDGVIIYDGYNEEDNTIIEYDEEENIIHISFSNEEHETYCKYGYVIIPESSVSCSEYYIGNLAESESSLTDDISESYFTSFYKSDVDSIRIIIYKVCQMVSMNEFLQLKALVENMI